MEDEKKPVKTSLTKKHILKTIDAVSELRTDVSVLKDDVGELQKTMTDLVSTVNNMTYDLDKVIDNQKDLKPALNKQQEMLVEGALKLYKTLDSRCASLSFQIDQFRSKHESRVHDESQPQQSKDEEEPSPLHQSSVSENRMVCSFNPFEMWQEQLLLKKKLADLEQQIQEMQGNNPVQSTKKRKREGLESCKALVSQWLINLVKGQNFIDVENF